MTRKNGTRSSDPGPLPPASTYCVHCNQPFPQAVPIIGSPMDSEYHNLCIALGMHLTQKHPDVAKTNVERQVVLGWGMSSRVVLESFASTDEGLMQWADRQRYEVLKFAQQPSVSDMTIETKVGEVFHLWASQHPDDADQLKANVVALLKSMRDAIEERNRYPEPVHLVQPAVLSA